MILYNYYIRKVSESGFDSNIESGCMGTLNLNHFQGSEVSYNLRGKAIHEKALGRAFSFVLVFVVWTTYK